MFHISHSNKLISSKRKLKSLKAFFSVCGEEDYILSMQDFLNLIERETPFLKSAKTKLLLFFNILLQFLINLWSSSFETFFVEKFMIVKKYKTFLP